MPLTMTDPSRLSTITFLLIVLSVGAFLVLASLKVADDDAAPHAGRARVLRILALILIVGLVIPGILARVGLLDRWEPLPPPAMLMVAAVTLGTIALALGSFGARLAGGLPLAALVGYQAFRAPLEWVLHRLSVEGVIPVEMTYAGRNFDVITGVTALALALYLIKGRRARLLVLVWNVIGLILLANIVTVAVLSTPVPFRAFTNGPPNLLPGVFPWVWLPTFLVQAALFGHLVVFRALAREARSTGRT